MLYYLPVDSHPSNLMWSKGRSKGRPDWPFEITIISHFLSYSDKLEYIFYSKFVVFIVLTRDGPTQVELTVLCTWHYLGILFNTHNKKIMFHVFRDVLEIPNLLSSLDSKMFYSILHSGDDSDTKREKS